MRKKKDYLPELLEYIDLVNKIPQDYSFPSRSEIAEKTFERLSGKNPPQYEHLIETCEMVLKDLPPDLYHFIFSTDLNESAGIFEFIQERLDLLSSLHFGLFYLGYFVTEIHFYSDENTLELNEYLAGLREQLPGQVAEPKVKINVDKDGFLQLKTNEFLDFISNNKIEANRIRYCLVCSKIYWANRKDMWNCSKTCSNTRRQRFWLSEHKNEYNERRRRNYAYKQSIKKLKEN